jgi:pimeloyl-ACP methyl ester carboxylesterase
MLEPEALRLRLQTELVGEGPPRAAFLHGLLGRGRNWQLVAKALAQAGYPSLLIDLPNHGESEWTERFSYPKMADQVAAELRGLLGGRRITLIGHSMGGKTAMLIALRHWELLHKLVVIDIAPSHSAGVERLRPALEAAAALDLCTLSSRANADERLRESIPDAALRALVLQNLRSLPSWHWQPNIALLSASLKRIAAWPKVTQANYLGPVLWLKGENSTHIRPADDAEMYRLFPNTEKLEIADAGHWVHADQPQAVVGALTAFLED